MSMLVNLLILISGFAFILSAFYALKIGRIFGGDDDEIYYIREKHIVAFWANIISLFMVGGLLVAFGVWLVFNKQQF